MRVYWRDERGNLHETLTHLSLWVGNEPTQEADGRFYIDWARYPVVIDWEHKYIHAALPIVTSGNKRIVRPGGYDKFRGQAFRNEAGNWVVDRPPGTSYRRFGSNGCRPPSAYAVCPAVGLDTFQQEYGPPDPAFAAHIARRNAVDEAVRAINSGDFGAVLHEIAHGRGLPTRVEAAAFRHAQAPVSVLEWIAENGSCGCGRYGARLRVSGDPLWAQKSAGAYDILMWH